jgi:hypothetical protein
MVAHRPDTRALVAALLAIAALGGCGGGGKDPGVGQRIQVRGAFGSGITLASRETGLRKILAWLAPGKAWADPGDTIDNVLAADADGNFILATKSGNGFTLSLPAGHVYLVAFLSGTTTKAIYRADPSGSGWIALPVGTGSHDVDLGTLTFDASGVGTGTTSSSTVATNLGVDAGVQSALAAWDAAMQRLANVDVDGDGTFDFEQGRRYDFGLHYEFTPAARFADIQGSTFSDQSATTYLGYGYYFNAWPGGTHDWSTATLTAPAAITPTGQAPSTTRVKCWTNVSAGSGASVNFYCGSGIAPGDIAVLPVQPPAGNYTVTVDGSTTFQFRGVASQVIDANLYNVYIPSVRVAMSSGKVASLDVQWWKRTPDGWSQPSAAELSAIMAWAGWEVGQADWQGDPNTSRVSGSLPVAQTASATAPAQSFTPGALRVSYRDAFGYGYGFEWR